LISVASWFDKLTMRRENSILILSLSKDENRFKSAHRPSCFDKLSMRVFTIGFALSIASP